MFSGPEANGQDDIIWYTATQLNNGTYKVSVDSSRHKVQLAGTIPTMSALTGQ